MARLSVQQKMVSCAGPSSSGQERPLSPLSGAPLCPRPSPDLTHQESWGPLGATLDVDNEVWGSWPELGPPTSRSLTPSPTAGRHRERQVGVMKKKKNNKTGDQEADARGPLDLTP